MENPCSAAPASRNPKPPATPAPKKSRSASRQDFRQTPVPPSLRPSVAQVAKTFGKPPSLHPSIPPSLRSASRQDFRPRQAGRRGMGLAERLGDLRYLRPVTSGNPNMTFIFWIAAPLAPLARLSMAQTKTARSPQSRAVI
ncbi:hypothetical protein K227x_24540 [Rubripirellula lacrimiformis]|uniref:Uncharacterized protein n=1 Tax=Rubripirellula lacrimiformis TaxID=1930273 RepID=A0A517NAM4_9BACT|nr:hypothetical protein K227x_24540 [Rubripirellula lacrimiformis]